MFTMIVALVGAIVVAIVTRILYAVTGNYHNRPSFGSWTFFALLAFGFLMAYIKHDNLVDENYSRLDQWNANQCVAPEEIAKSVFVVDLGGGHGTGFMLEGNTMVTNRHVAEAGGGEVTVITNSDAEYGAMQLHVADARTRPDLAFYYVRNGGGIPTLQRATESPKTGDQLLVVGSPQYRPNFYSTVVNVIGTTPEEEQNVNLSTLTTVYSWVVTEVMQIITPSSLVDGGTLVNARTLVQGDIGPGNSGSPVVNCQGEVVGVIYGGVTMSMTASDTYGMAVTVEDLTEELQKLPPIDTPTTTDNVS